MVYPRTHYEMLEEWTCLDSSFGLLMSKSWVITGEMIEGAKVGGDVAEAVIQMQSQYPPRLLSR